MGQLYVLKLRGGKWYVGYTDRSSMDRILEHIENKGAKWTKAHPPLKKGYLHNFTTPGKTREDEDKRTLYLMKQHGIENVRGGSWCMVKMRKKTVRELEALISKPKSSAKKTVKKKVQKSRPKKVQVCGRCGRDSHNRAGCYATTTVDGVTITTKSWKYRPKTKPKEKPKKAPRGKTVVGRSKKKDGTVIDYHADGSRTIDKRKSKGDKKAKRTYNRYRKGGRKGQR